MIAKPLISGLAFINKDLANMFSNGALANRFIETI
jgi:hypothetical protein